MKINSLNLFIYEQKFFLEKIKNNLKSLCYEKNYNFLFYSIQKDNYPEIAQNIDKELYTSCFFYVKKVLFIENISFLFSKKNINLNFLLNFFKDPENNIIIYLVEEKDNNFPLDIQEKINNYFIIEKQNKLSYQNLINHTQKLFEEDGFVVTSKIISFLIQKTQNNLLLLQEEIQKIKLYYLSCSNKNIENIEIIKQLVVSTDDSVFLFINSIINNSKMKDNFDLLDNLINHKYNSMFIIYQILQKLQEMILIQHLINEKKREVEISTLLQYSLPKTFNLIKEIKLLSMDKIENLFLILFKIYYKVKQGLIEPEKALRYLWINQNI
ncbi:DNA polymerase III subunit delta [Candidatus Phytoplasma ziziphi]|uniref:DNA polymerase III subunit delta n=1 Tax=Ziziphus jujuba witches'-broom phytoplasma TaxID=135727 RepID=A0A660HNB1_ZIZJU|nr:DNA polymerase III subunit delta [Candidatus Phytoplasma ziziphi]AYJ01256.1 DNA polymerase III subunit delta [Candidatus Phytoplasma ziziphi]